jgi:hypothetical protein
MRKIKFPWKKAARAFTVILVVIVLVGILLGYGLAEAIEFIADLWH